jgi:DNA-binding CsgD family transcriptional regulator
VQSFIWQVNTEIARHTTPSALMFHYSRRCFADEHQGYKLLMKSGSLSPREREVIERVAQGQTDKEIARQLGLSINTIIGYVRSARQKLGASNRAAAVTQYYTCLGAKSQSEMGDRQTSNE